MTRAEHLQWAKDRALAYLPGNPQEALVSMMSDLGKHEDLTNHAAIDLGFMLFLSGNLATPEKVREFIEGFN